MDWLVLMAVFFSGALAGGIFTVVAHDRSFRRHSGIWLDKLEHYATEQRRKNQTHGG